MSPNRWLNWRPEDQISDGSPKHEPTKPTKPTKPGFVGFVGSTSGEAAKIDPLEGLLKGRAVELYLAGGDRLFIVADGEDAAQLCEPRGVVYTAAEVRQVVKITDPETVSEIHRWKRMFNGSVSGDCCNS